MVDALKETSTTLVVRMRRGLPSAREAASAYLACLVPIVAWSVFRMLDDGLPGWARQMRFWDVIGTVAYVQAFALAECTVVFLPLLVLSVILPLGWFRHRFVALATGLVYLSAVWFVVAQFNDDALRRWGFRQLLPWVAAYAGSLLLLSLLVHRSPRFEASLRAFVERVSVLATAYFVVAVAAVVIVVVRNL